MNSAAPENQKKEKLSLKKLLEIFLSMVKELFISSLILYLILFILESVFPGFVSNNFDLNYVLFGVIALGLVSAFAPEEPKEEEKKTKPKISDYLISIFLGLVGGILIFYKVQLDFTIRVVVALFCGIFIIAISLILLLVEDEEVEEKEEEIEEFFQDTFLSRKTFTTPIALFRMLIYRKVNFPIVLILIVFLFTILSLPPRVGYAPRKIDVSRLVSQFKSPEKQKIAEPTLTLTPQKPTPTIKKVVPSVTLMIKILNGSTQKDAASNFAKTLKDAGFVKVFFGEADNTNYKNAIIRFRQEDEEQARLINNLLEKNYKTISGEPSASPSAEITVILGTPTSEELEF